MTARRIGASGQDELTDRTEPVTHYQSATRIMLMMPRRLRAT
jgi:hypothetical protein